ncbi:uncharacterized mitochondrial protein-like protein [Tanacetum coccineum]
MVLVRALLAVAIYKKWFIEQLDITNAFLHGDLHEEVYMSIPQGYPTPVSPNISYANTSLFTFTKGTQYIALLIYVDDILLSENDKSLIQAIKQQLDQQFNIKDLGSLHYYLGIEIIQNSKGLVMSQRKYALDLLQCADALNLKPFTIPLDPLKNLNLTDGEPLSDPSLYRNLVGKFIYLTITRPVSSGVKLSSRQLPVWESATQRPQTLRGQAFDETRAEVIQDLAFLQAPQELFDPIEA